MRRVREGEVPPDGGTALQDDPDRPVFRGNGPYDYVCVRVRQRARARRWGSSDEQARADQVRALQDDQRRRLRPQGRDVTGFGSVRRKEDARFIRGQGALRRRRPAAAGCCTARSCARRSRTRGSSRSTPRRRCSTRRSTRCSPAPTSATMAWMPTMSADAQAVLATDKVRFQGQEVAFVIADDHYSARDALELIDVEYELLPAVVDARAALEPDAPVIRDDEPGRIDNHIFDWEAGDAAATDAVVRARRRGRGRAGDAVPALAPGADGDLRRGRGLRPRRRQADASGARRRRRTRTARCTRSITGLPEHKHPGDLARRRRRLRQQGPGLSRLRLRDRRGAAARAGRSSGSRTARRT